MKIFTALDASNRAFALYLGICVAFRLAMRTFVPCAIRILELRIGMMNQELREGPGDINGGLE